MIDVRARNPSGLLEGRADNTERERHSRKELHLVRWGRGSVAEHRFGMQKVSSSISGPTTEQITNREQMM